MRRADAGGNGSLGIRDDAKQSIGWLEAESQEDATELVTGREERARRTADGAREKRVIFEECRASAFANSVNGTIGEKGHWDGIRKVMLGAKRSPWYWK